MAETSVKDRPCATEGCENPAKLRLEVGGVSSDYCPECYAKIDLDAPPAPEALTVLDQALDGPAPEAEGATGADTADGGGAEVGVNQIESIPPVTIRRLRAVIAEIEARNTDLHREALLRELFEEHGANISPELMSFTLDEVTCSVPPSKEPKATLVNWCSAARRAILSGAIPE